MNTSHQVERDIHDLAGLFQLLAQPARLQILFGIGHGEVCVCHLEALLKERQAYISQELMMLKNAGLVDCRRAGRNIYYHLENPKLLEQILAFCQQQNQPTLELNPGPIPDCSCPQCNPGAQDCLQAS